MSDVVREGVIRLRYEVEKAKLEAPEVSQAVKAHDDVTQAATKTAQAEQAVGAASQAAAQDMTQRAHAARSSMAEAADAHEDFGRRSAGALAHAGHGVIQLARGIALMSASGEEDTKKLLESLVKIEAAVSIAKGVSNLSKVAGEFGAAGKAAGAVGVILAVGAAVWNKYSSEVEKAKKALEAEAEAAHKARDANRELAARTEKIANDERARKTDTGVTPGDRKEAADKELEDIRRERAAAGEQARAAENARLRAGREEDIGRSGVRTAGLMTTREKAAEWVATHTTGGTYGRESMEAHYTKVRDEAHAREQGQRKVQISATEKQLSGEERERQLIERQRDDDIEERRKREEAEMSALQGRLSPSDPRQQAMVAKEKAKYDAEQRKKAAQLEETGLTPEGFEYGRSFEESQAVKIHSSARSDIEGIRRDANAAVNAVSDIVTNLKTQLESLRAKLDAGAPR